MSAERSTLEELRRILYNDWLYASLVANKLGPFVVELTAYTRSGNMVKLTLALEEELSLLAWHVSRNFNIVWEYENLRCYRRRR